MAFSKAILSSSALAFSKANLSSSALAFSKAIFSSSALAISKTILSSSALAFSKAFFNSSTLEVSICSLFLITSTGGLTFSLITLLDTSSLNLLNLSLKVYSDSK